MNKEEHIICTVVPDGISSPALSAGTASSAPAAAALKFAVFFTPMVTEAIGAAGNQPVENDLSFVDLTILQSLPTKRDQWKIQLEIADPSLAGSQAASAFLSTSPDFPIMESQAFWNALLGNCWVKLVKTAADGVSAQLDGVSGNKVVPDMVIANSNPTVSAVLGSAVGGASTVTGAGAGAAIGVSVGAIHGSMGASVGSSVTQALGSESLRDMIALPFLQQTVLPESSKPLAGNVDFLRRTREALRRMDRAGTSGPSATATKEKAESETAQNKNRPEFHESVSSLGNYPQMLRSFGLILDVSVPLACLKQNPEVFHACAWVDLNTFTLTIRLTAADRPSNAPGMVPVPIPTRCWLRSDLFTPQPRKIIEKEPVDEDSLDGIHLLGRNFDTMQLDVMALVRAALRREDEIAAPRASADSAQAALGPDPTLLSHGITVFRKSNCAATFVESVARRLRDQGKIPPSEWWADDLMSGFVVDVQKRDPTTGKAFDVPRSLNQRVVSVSLPGKNQFCKLWDEGPLTFGITEASQPLSGWLISAMEEGKYLLSTLADGFVILNDIRQEIKKMVTSQNPTGKFLFGQWIELGGVVGRDARHAAGWFFEVHRAHLGLGPRAMALAGPIVGRASVQGKLVSSTILRWAVDQYSPKQKVVRGRVYLQADNPEEIKNSINQAGSVAQVQYLSARGVPVLAEAKASLADDDQPRLEFVRMDGYLSVFTLPDLSPAAQNAAGLIRLDLRKITPKLLAGSDLVAGNVYRLTFQDIKKASLEVLEVIEETVSAPARIKGFRKEGSVILLETEDDRRVVITDDTEIAINEAISPSTNPPPPSSASMSNGDQFSEEEEKAKPGDIGQRVRIFGKWPSQGLRLGPGDVVKMQLRPLETDGKTVFAVSRLVVLAFEEKMVRHGYFTSYTRQLIQKKEDEDKNQISGRSLRFTDLDTGKSMPIEVDDSTLIIVPPVLGRAMRGRTYNAPPLNTLVEVRLDGSSVGVLKARRIEAMSSLRGTILSAEDSAGSAKLKLPGLKNPISIQLPSVTFSESVRKGLHGRFAEVSLSFDATSADRHTVVAMTIQTEAYSVTAGKVIVVGFDGMPILDSNQLPADGRFYVVELMWTMPSATPALRNIRAVVTSVTGQVVVINPEEKSFSLRMLRGDANNGALVLGDAVRIFFQEQPSQEGGTLWDRWKDRLPLAKESGVPLQVEADLGVLVPGDRTDPAQLADWSIFCWSATPPVSKWWAAGISTLAGVSVEGTLFPGNHRTTTVARNLVVLKPANQSKCDLIGLPVEKEAISSDEKLKITLPPESQPSAVPQLLGDQFVLEDTMFHWSGQNLVTRQFGEEKAANADAPRLDIRTEAPSQSQVPLRQGWGYLFGCRAYYLTGPARRPTTKPIAPAPPPAVASLQSDRLPLEAEIVFRALGGRDVADMPKNIRLAYEQYLRLDRISSPRIGWPLKGDRFAPDKTYGVADVTGGDDLLRRRDWWGTPTDLLLFSDTRVQVALPAPASRQSSTSALPPPPLGAEKFKDEEQPVLLIRPPEITVQQADVRGAFDAWMKRNNFPDPGKLFDLIVGFELQEVETGNTPPTLGLLLPRLPDPDALELVGILDEALLQVVTHATDNSFRSNDWKKVWPVWQDVKLALRKGIPSDSLTEAGKRTITWDVSTSLLTLKVPRDADWTLEFAAKPTPDIINFHLVPLLLGEGIPTPPASGVPASSSSGALQGDTQKTQKSPREIALDAINDGLNRMVSSRLAVRIRHCTNRPARPPRKVDMYLYPRNGGETGAILRGKFEIDVPSTATLTIQTATQMNWVDDQQLPLPTMPQEAMAQLIYYIDERPALNTNLYPDEGVPFWGVTSDQTTRIDTAEHIVTEVPLDSPRSIGPKDASPVMVQWKQEFGDMRSHTVYVRALAVSRFTSYFLPGETQTNPLPGPFTKQQVDQYVGDYGSRDDKTVREREMLHWHRVEVPATKRPAPPLINQALTLFQWDPIWQADGPWQGGGDRWFFTRTRTSGCRLWLERPWFSSGANEKLGVLCWMTTRVPRADVERYIRTVSRWGKDPVNEIKLDDTMGLFTRKEIISAEEGIGNLPAVEFRPDAAVSEGIVESEADLRIALAAHTPIFHQQAQKWFCDIFIKSRNYTPFVWLSVARYQPHALHGLALSPIVRLEHPVQILPPRTLTVDLIVRRGVLEAEIKVIGIASPAGKHRVTCVVERLLRDGDYVAPRHTDIAIAMAGDEAGIPSIGVGDGIWQPIVVSDSNGDRQYQANLNRSGKCWQTQIAIEPVPEWRVRDDKSWKYDPSDLRITVKEEELYDPAHRLAAGEDSAGRPPYTDSIVLPAEAIQRIRDAMVAPEVDGEYNPATYQRVPAQSTGRL